MPRCPERQFEGALRQCHSCSREAEALTLVCVPHNCVGETFVYLLMRILLTLFSLSSCDQTSEPDFSRSTLLLKLVSEFDRIRCRSHSCTDGLLPLHPSFLAATSNKAAAAWTQQERLGCGTRDVTVARSITQPLTRIHRRRGDGNLSLTLVCSSDGAGQARRRCSLSETGDLVSTCLHEIRGENTSGN